jgi:hypothetical protein
MLIAKINLMLVGIRASADRHPVPFEDFPHPKGLPTETDDAFGADFSCCVVGTILHGRQLLGQLHREPDMQ